MRRMFMLGMVLLIAAGLSVTAAGAAPKGIDVTGEHYNLNLHFKENYKEDWSANSTDRHTMFLPYITPTESIYLDGCIDYDGDGVVDNMDPETGVCTPAYIDGIQLYISQGDEWAVTDANCYDGICSLQLPAGRYKVFAVARAKPGGFTDISGWLYYDYTDESGNTEYYFDLGDIRVTKKTEWDNITGMFYVLPAQDNYGLFELGGVFEGSSSAWVFEYLDALYGEGYDGGYFWQIVNSGNKLVKVRFYPI